MHSRTATPAPTGTPEPTSVLPVLREAGRGDKVLTFQAQDRPLVAQIMSAGSSDFVVVAYAGSEYDDLLVNWFGSYSGWVYVAPGVNVLEITSNGSWTVWLQDISSAHQWNGTIPVGGRGDSVILLTGGASHTTTITTKGSDNFAVIAYSVDGDYLDRLVNAIGSSRGEVLLPSADPIVLSVHAEGVTWSMSALK